MLFESIFFFASLHPRSLRYAYILLFGFSGICSPNARTSFAFKDYVITVKRACKQTIEKLSSVVVFVCSLVFFAVFAQAQSNMNHTALSLRHIEIFEKYGRD